MVLFPWLVSLKQSLAQPKARNKRRALVRPESLEPRALLTVMFTNDASAMFDAAGTTLVIDTDEDVVIGVDLNGFVTVNGSKDLDGAATDDDILAEFVEQLVVDAPACDGLCDRTSVGEGGGGIVVGGSGCGTSSNAILHAVRSSSNAASASSRKSTYL